MDNLQTIPVHNWRKKAMERRELRQIVENAKPHINLHRQECEMRTDHHPKKNITKTQTRRHNVRVQRLL